MLNGINENHASLVKAIFIALGGLAAGAISFFQPIYIYIVICVLAKIIDIVFAVRLSVRIKKSSKKSSGKIKSKLINKFFVSMTMFILFIMLSFMLDKFVVLQESLPMSRFACGAFVFQQIWSCLESESSSNHSKWAKQLQKIMIDKSERHFDINLSEYKDKKDDK